jgi:Flp pilus assembly pilin Flp
MTRASLIRFAKDESGAVTVDWVVLTAAVVGLTVVLFTVITPGSFDAATGLIGDTMVAASEYARDTESVEIPAPEQGEGGEVE